jgi:5-amino-6-(5-phosphoribosylamino)uracil reductase/diaminohydroxyphosphoribosylaminopyrimidine deaminase/5-amino-6-(5-phosphoribosylamino)uracil reductase
MAVQEQVSRPSITIHYAQTLDGRIATRTGHSQWISCSASLELAHQLRAEHQGIMVGIGTVLADNPRLTVRLVPGDSPCRIIVDSTLRIPLDTHVLTDGAAATIIATTARAPAERIEAVRRSGVEVLVVASDSAGRVDLATLVGRLAEMGLASLLLEGGAGLITSALHHHLVDRLIVCISPKLIGTGKEAVGNLNIQRMSDALTFARSSFTTLGEDIIFDGHFEPEVPGSSGVRAQGG